MAASEDILLLNLTRMGDLVQSTPLAVGLKKKFPGARIVAGVNDFFLSTARLMDGVDEIVPVDYMGMKALARKDASDPIGMVSRAEEMLAPLLSRPYRMVVNLTHSHASSILMYLLDSPDKRGVQMVDSGHRVIRHPWMLFMHNFAVNKEITPFNLVDIYAQAGDVPTHLDPIPLSLRVPPEADAWAEEFLAGETSGEGPLVAVQAGASDAHKMWHPSSFIRTCRILRDAAGARFLFVGGPDEVDLAGKIRDVVDAPGSVLAAGRTDIPRLCGLLRRCDLMITNDTGPMHLAAAVGTPVVSLALGPVFYCNTGPYGEGHVVFQPGASCAPCAFTVRCVNPECKNLVTPEAVAAVALRRLRKEPLEEGCLPDDPAFAGCEVYLSRRGEDGLMDYVPLLARPRSDRWRLERAYRKIWGDVLLHDRRPPGSERPVPPGEDRLAAHLLRLEKLAAEGQEAAHEIYLHRKRPERHIAMFRERMERIRECSGKIRETGMGMPPVNGLAQMFAFEEENMADTGDLGAAARENVELFGNLLRRTRSLAYLLANATHYDPRPRQDEGRPRCRAL